MVTESIILAIAIIASAFLICTVMLQTSSASTSPTTDSIDAKPGVPGRRVGTGRIKDADLQKQLMAEILKSIAESNAKAYDEGKEA